MYAKIQKIKDMNLAIMSDWFFAWNSRVSVTKQL